MPSEVALNGPIQELIAALTAARRHKGIKRADVAAACNSRAWFIKMVEQGYVEPTLSLLLDYAEAVDMTLTWRLEHLNGPVV